MTYCNIEMANYNNKEGMSRRQGNSVAIQGKRAREVEAVMALKRGVHLVLSAPIPLLQDIAASTSVRR